MLSTVIYLITSVVFASTSYDPIVAKLDADLIHYSTVADFIERNLLDDQAKIAFFNRAGKNWDKYQLDKKEFIKNNFDEGLKNYLYTYVLYKDYKLTGASVDHLFKMSSSQSLALISEIENRHLAPFLKSGKGINFARESYAQTLIDRNYPIAPNTSTLDLYWEWYHNEERKIEDSHRKKSVSEWENYRTQENRVPISVEPLERVSLYRQVEKELKNLFNAPMTSKDFSQILSKNPQYSLLTNNLNILDLKILPLREFNEKTRVEIASKLEEMLSEDVLNSFWKYETKAVNLAQKYGNKDELKNLSAKEMAYFLNQPTASYSNLMLSKLYLLASFIIDNDDRSSNERDELKVSIVNEVKNFIRDFKEDKLSTDTTLNSLSLGNALSIYLSKKFSLASAPVDYRTSILDILIWSTEFQVKKLTSTHQELVTYEMRPLLDTETFNRLNDYLKFKKFKVYLDDFKNSDLKRVAERVIIFDEESRVKLEGEKAAEFIFSI